MVLTDVLFKATLEEAQIYILTVYDEMNKWS